MSEQMPETLRKKLVADYSHPWPNEDDGTKRHRLGILAQLRVIRCYEPPVRKKRLPKNNHPLGWPYNDPNVRCDC